MGISDLFLHVEYWCEEHNIKPEYLYAGVGLVILLIIGSLLFLIPFGDGEQLEPLKNDTVNKTIELPTYIEPFISTSGLSLTKEDIGKSYSVDLAGTPKEKVYINLKSSDGESIYFESYLGWRLDSDGEKTVTLKITKDLYNKLTDGCNEISIVIDDEESETDCIFAEKDVVVKNDTNTTNTTSTYTLTILTEELNATNRTDGIKLTISPVPTTSNIYGYLYYDSTHYVQLGKLKNKVNDSEKANYTAEVSETNFNKLLDGCNEFVVKFSGEEAGPKCVEVDTTPPSWYSLLEIFSNQTYVNITRSSLSLSFKGPGSKDVDLKIKKGSSTKKTYSDYVTLNSAGERSKTYVLTHDDFLQIFTANGIYEFIPLLADDSSFDHESVDIRFNLTNDCNTTGDRICDPNAQNKYMVCSQGADRKVWGSPQECPSGEICDDGLCIEGSCVDRCNLGQQNCTVDGKYQLCGYWYAHGCLDWSSDYEDTLCLNEMCDPGLSYPSCWTDMECVDLETQQCYGGSVATQDVGVCSNGTQVCRGGLWDTCLGDVLPSTEICNNLDDDCDGTVDEGCDDDNDNYCDASMTVTTSTTCSLGGGDCNDTNSSINPGATEECNLIDDDCTGGVDNGDLCGTSWSCILGECLEVECATDLNCDDSDPCTTDVCQNPGTTSSSCSNTPIANDCGTRVCGPSASGCVASCGTCSNGVCNAAGQCADYVCTTDTDCDDGDACTTDTCSNGGTASASCSNTAIANDCGSRECGPSPTGCFTCGTCSSGTCDDSGQCIGGCTYGSCSGSNTICGTGTIDCVSYAQIQCAYTQTCDGSCWQQTPCPDPDYTCSGGQCQLDCAAALAPYGHSQCFSLGDKECTGEQSNGQDQIRECEVWSGTCYYWHETPCPFATPVCDDSGSTAQCVAGSVGTPDFTVTLGDYNDENFVEFCNIGESFTGNDPNVKYEFADPNTGTFCVATDQGYASNLQTAGSCYSIGPVSSNVITIWEAVCGFDFDQTITTRVTVNFDGLIDEDVTSNNVDTHDVCFGNCGPDPDTDSSACVPAIDVTSGDYGIAYGGDFSGSSSMHPECCGDDTNEWLLDKQIERAPGVFNSQSADAGQVCCDASDKCAIWSTGCAAPSARFHNNELYCNADGSVSVCNIPMQCQERGGYICSYSPMGISTWVTSVVYPEVCGDGIDNNCDGTIDEGCIDYDNNEADCTSEGWFYFNPWTPPYSVEPNCCGDDANEYPKMKGYVADDSPDVRFVSGSETCCGNSNACVYEGSLGCTGPGTLAGNSVWLCSLLGAHNGDIDVMLWLECGPNRLGYVESQLSMECKYDGSNYYWEAQ